MYGLIVKLTATPGRRDELITLMGGDDSHTIPGCLSFIVAEDTTTKPHSKPHPSKKASQTRTPSSPATKKSPPPPQ